MKLNVYNFKNYKMKKLKFIIPIFLFVFNLNAQILTPIENAEEQAQTQQRETSIIDVWNPEGAAGVDYIFSQNNLVIQINGQTYKTYYWAIFTGTTPSGLKISHLITENIQDPTDRYEYEIDIINNERMILVYNNGIGLQRNLYFRQ